MIQFKIDYYSEERKKFTKALYEFFGDKTEANKTLNFFDEKIIVPVVFSLTDHCPDPLRQKLMRQKEGDYYANLAMEIELRTPAIKKMREKVTATHIYEIAKDAYGHMSTRKFHCIVPDDVLRHLSYFGDGVHTR